MSLKLESPRTGLETQACFLDSTQELGPVPIIHYLGIINFHKWIILAFVLTSAIIAYAVSARISRVYEATAIVEVDWRTPSGVVGQEAKETFSNDADPFLATQTKILQTDAVLRPVAIKYGLLEKEAGSSGGTSQGAKNAPEGPVILKKLRISRVPGTYLIEIGYRSPDPKLAADVANAVATSYMEYTSTGRSRSSTSLAGFMERQMDELKAKMERSSGALVKFERELNMINPAEKTNIISARLLQLNQEYTTAQTDRVRKELAYQSTKDGAIEAAQVSTQGTAFTNLTDRLQKAEAKFADFSALFGENHPEYKRQSAEIAALKRQIDETRQNVTRRIQIEYEQAAAREKMLGAAVSATKQEFDRLNARSFEYLSLKQVAEGDRKLYEELDRRIKEEGINANFQSNAIRIADFARPPEEPISPNIPLNVALCVFASLLVAAGASVLVDSADKTVRDPGQIAKLFNVDVIASLPVNSVSKQPVMVTDGSDGSSLVPAQNRFSSEYEDSVRVLRSTIFLSDFSRRLKSLMITSAMPGEGKTTTALELCRAHAQQKRKTMLIDADLRRPSVHTRLNINPAVGLADYLTGDKDWREVVVGVPGEPFLDMLPAGRVSRVVADLAIHALPQLIDEMSQEYDLIVVDSQPLLGFSEPLQIATAVDGVIVIARAGKTDRNAVSTALATLNRVHARTLGIVLNRVSSTGTSAYYYYHDYKHYAS